MRSRVGSERLVPARGQTAPLQRPGVSGNRVSLTLPQMMGQAQTLYQSGRLSQAEQLCRGLLALSVDHYEALNLLGIIAAQTQRLTEAVQLLERAVAVRPSEAMAHNSRGNVLRSLTRFEEALESFDQALRLRPEYVEAWNNRGTVLKELQHFDAALQSFDRALRLRPDYVEAHCNRGNLLTQLNRLQAAVASFDQAVALAGNFAPARVNRAIALLLMGDFERGWADYQWRWAGRAQRPQPLWLGQESLAGKTILLCSEQGLGDTIQFCRYARLVADQGARVVLEVPRSLSSLLQSLDGVTQLVAVGEALPAFDWYCPLMSLPLALKTTLSTIPAQIPYLRSSAERLRHWDERLGERRGLRVGLVWSGGPSPDQARLWSYSARRNISLATLAPLRRAAGIEFYSLQKGKPADSELAELTANQWQGPPIRDFASELHDFADTAALMEQLDLVVTVDTATAHLAGALGKPVWILNRFDSCWRWLTERTDSPWYPTARLYRQERPGEWEGVVQRVAADLQRLLQAGAVERS